MTDARTPVRTPVRVVVADDDAGFRAALVEVLEADGRFEVVGQTVDGGGLADLAERTAADLVVVDVRMPHGGARAVIDLLDHFERSSTGPRVCALSAQIGTTTVEALVAAGATGFLAKGFVGAGVADLLARCAAGEVVLAVPTAGTALHHLVAARAPTP